MYSIDVDNPRFEGILKELYMIETRDLSVLESVIGSLKLITSITCGYVKCVSSFHRMA